MHSTLLILVVTLTIVGALYYYDDDKYNYKQTDVVTMRFDDDSNEPARRYYRPT